jgi:tRNA (guanine26-N2/guanine27-N2)-dimethyltransferase
MDYGLVTEGATRLKVPIGGGISKKEEVFYNPHMALNRDVTVALCRIIKPRTFLDLMAGSGSRGIRVANEAGIHVTLNDLNPKAADLVRENAELNDVNVDIEQVDARRLLAGRRFSYVDVDPFGTPAPYVDVAVSAVKAGGVLGICATDTSALSGTYPAACKRKYDAVPLRCDCYDEIGLRILLGHIARCAMRQERGVKPLFTHSSRHYMRVQVKVAGRPRETLKSMAYLQYCFGCGFRGYRRLGELASECGCGGVLRNAGPLWSIGFADPKLCGELAGELVEGEYACKSESVKLVETVGGEQAVHTPYYDLHKLCKKASVPAPRMDALADSVKSAGFTFTRTHFNPTGFRSDMPVDSITPLLKV